jgi:hypothetical protein
MFVAVRTSSELKFSVSVAAYTAWGIAAMKATAARCEAKRHWRAGEAVQALLKRLVAVAKEPD